MRPPRGGHRVGFAATNRRWGADGIPTAVRRRRATRRQSTLVKRTSAISSMASTGRKASVTAGAAPVTTSSRIAPRVTPTRVANAFRRAGVAESALVAASSTIVAAWRRCDRRTTGCRPPGNDDSAALAHCCRLMRVATLGHEAASIAAANSAGSRDDGDPVGRTRRARNARVACGVLRSRLRRSPSRRRARGCAAAVTVR